MVLLHVESSMLQSFEVLHAIFYYFLYKIQLLIRSLDLSKAHGCDNISNAMIKICNAVIVEPLCMIFEKSLATGQYPSMWK